MISLQQAKELVALLENEQQQDANSLLLSIYRDSENAILNEIGLLTRELHESLKQFSLDERMTQIAKDEIPDAKDRLQYVIQKTEQAANTTMDAVERCLPLADSLNGHLTEVRPQWNQLMHGRIQLNEFKHLCHSIDDLLTRVEGDSTEVRGQLTEILMAQDFQDLTGQIIRRVIALVNEVEGRLVEILTVFSAANLNTSNKEEKSSLVAEGPIINPEQREDAVSSQDEVDDLLSSLGF
ncbi:protein phosphatase [Vibrio astriarenae]|uniref:Protein phosphatase CheZ n=1 Tax=Vibrio astriarenae TaxID=1481923 RepID=A0A7Z2YD09_9VIBR|nr:protein phosphatase CheZ [Vibrio astriarenae]QIA62851.1 protein phosphatase [Vibrio astriarenae]